VASLYKPSSEVLLGAIYDHWFKYVESASDIRKQPLAEYKLNPEAR